MTLADLHLGFGNGKRGLELLELATRLRPREFSVWLNMGKLLSDRGDVSRAVRVYEKAVGLDPSHREALIGLIGAELKSSRPQRAGPWVAKSLEMYPDDPVFLGLACARRTGRIDSMRRFHSRTGRWPATRETSKRCWRVHWLGLPCRNSIKPCPTRNGPRNANPTPWTRSTCC